MQFDTYTYAVFLPIVFLIYWALNRRLKLQNAFLLISSYVFYAWWDWRFLGLIIFTTLSTWLTGLFIPKGNKKFWAGLNIVVNLAILVTFKYYDFFAFSAAQLCHKLGFEPGWTALNLILPVGISFYTLQALSYTIDVYRNEVKPTRDILAFMVYIAFFPQLVAGPIERAKDLLPQMLKQRRWDSDGAVIGMRQILWGLAKKIIVADTISSQLSTILYHPSILQPLSVVSAAILFAFQIYADFSGYSDIAIGSARLLGIRLSVNFNYPYFSRNYREMWRKWHMSLMRWFVAYVYVPLGGSRHGKIKTSVNIMIVFALSGLWHGANWTFITWGILNGLFLLPLVFTGVKKRSDFATIREIPLCLFNFALMATAFLIFRLENFTQVTDCVNVLINGDWTIMPLGLTSLLIISIFIIIEWLGRKQEFPIKALKMPAWARWIIYWTLLAAIAYFANGQEIQYIYFQF